MTNTDEIVNDLYDIENAVLGAVTASEIDRCLRWMQMAEIHSAGHK
jgi:hypothetical protein